MIFNKCGNEEYYEAVLVDKTDSLGDVFYGVDSISDFSKDCTDYPTDWGCTMEVTVRQKNTEYAIDDDELFLAASAEYSNLDEWNVVQKVLEGIKNRDKYKFVRVFVHVNNDAQRRGSTFITFQFDDEFVQLTPAHNAWAEFIDGVEFGKTIRADWAKQRKEKKGLK